MKIMAKTAKEREFFTYKGKPFVRRGDRIYYGNPADKYIILFTIKSKREVNGLEIAKKVSIDLMLNSEKERVIKKAEREGLFAALDIAEFWLEDALENG